MLNVLSTLLLQFGISTGLFWQPSEPSDLKQDNRNQLIAFVRFQSFYMFKEKLYDCISDGLDCHRQTCFSKNRYTICVSDSVLAYFGQSSLFCPFWDYLSTHCFISFGFYQQSDSSTSVRLMSFIPS